jgi:hypothetical protein
MSSYPVTCKEGYTYTGNGKGKWTNRIPNKKQLIKHKMWRTRTKIMRVGKWMDEMDVDMIGLGMK